MEFSQEYRHKLTHPWTPDFFMIKPGIHREKKETAPSTTDANQIGLWHIEESK